MVTRATLAVALVALGTGLGAGCATPSAGQGGAKFHEVAQGALALPPEALYAVCWPHDAVSAQRVTLTFLPDDVVFEVHEGASNSTGRCLREIATTVAWPARPTGAHEVRPPAQPMDGWAALAWVGLLSPARFGPERGVLRPAPLIAQCLAKAGGLRPGSDVVVRHTPGYEVRVLPSAVGDAARCVEAVLSATAWPSSRELFFTLEAPRGRPAPEGDVALYVTPELAPLPPLEPNQVREVVRLAGPKVSACWDAALERRAAIGGGRTLRFRVDDTGAVTHAWVAATLSDGATAADLLLDECLGKTLRGLRFPPVAGDGVYTWVFATRG